MNIRRLLLFFGFAGVGSLLTSDSLIRLDDDDDDDQAVETVVSQPQKKKQKKTALRAAASKTVLKKQGRPQEPPHTQQTKQQPKEPVPCADIPEECDLANPAFGVPTILLSQGRSGSSSTWQLLESLGGAPLVLGATEPAGSNEIQALQFMNDQDPNEDGHCWLERYLCNKQRLNRKTEQRGNGLAANRIYGFKWKPWKKALHQTHSRQALDWLSRNPHIKVIRNRRNVVDVTASILKHDYYPVEANHCLAGDTACIQSHLAVQIDRPVSEWMGLLQEIQDNQVFCDQLLEEYHVPHLHVSYEKLYRNDETAAHEWMRLFRFINMVPSPPSLSYQDVQRHMEHAATSGSDRRQHIAHYNKLVAALKQTQFAKYLD